MITQRTSAANLNRYGLAIRAAITALLLRQLLAPVLGDQNPYHTAWAAVVFSAWYCAFGPSVLTVLMDLVGLWYWFLPPTGSFKLATPKADVAGMLGFVVFSALIIALSEAHRRSLAKRMWAEEELRNAHRDLERKVAERTTELGIANDNLRELSGRLQQLRDEERRQIARELHDSVGQMLAALSMNIGRVRAQSDKLDPATAAAVAENVGIVEQISKEIHTISHFLHPPLLDVAGLASAVRCYAERFGERRKIKVDVEIPAEVRRLSDQMEITIFRLIQECLTNIHRHSGSATPAIVIREEGNRVVVEVKDTGKGIPVDKQLEMRCGLPGYEGATEAIRRRVGHSVGQRRNVSQSYSASSTASGSGRGPGRSRLKACPCPPIPVTRSGPPKTLTRSPPDVLDFFSDRIANLLPACRC